MGTAHVILSVWRRLCGARPHDLPPREAIVWQQVRLFIAYRQHRLINITILIHHEMHINHIGATKSLITAAQSFKS